MLAPVAASTQLSGRTMAAGTDAGPTPGVQPLRRELVLLSRCPRVYRFKDAKWSFTIRNKQGRAVVACRDIHQSIAAHPASPPKQDAWRLHAG